MSLWRFLKRTVHDFFRLHISGRSAELAYYLLFSTAPLLIFLITISALLPIQDLLETTLSAIEEGMPANVSKLIRKQLVDVEGATGVTLTLGSMFLLLTSGSRIFQGLGQGIDAAYGVEQPRRFFKAKLVSVAMTFLLLSLILLTMIGLVFGPQLTRFVLQELSLDWMQTADYQFIRWGSSAGFMLITSSLLYWVLPTPRVKYFLISPGSLFATCGSVAATIGLGYYVDSFHRFNETYGTLGGIIALMIWYHLTGIFLLTGGLINGVIHRHVCDLETGQPKKKLRTLTTL